MAAPRILITRLSAIGDAILTLPLACAVRERFPEATLAWVVEKPASPLIRPHASLDRVIVLPKGWMKSPSTLAELRRELRAMRFDCVLDPQSLTKSALVGWLSGARERIGLARPVGRELAPWLHTELVRSTATHVVETFLDVARPLGIVDPAVSFQLPRFAEAEETVQRFCTEQRLAPGGFIALNPGASESSRQWPPERFGLLARELARLTGMRSVIVWAGGGEFQLAQRILETAAGSAIVAPRTSLPELAELLRRARLLVSGDTGPLHLGVAAGSSCIGLFGPTQAARTGPYGRKHLALQEYYQECTRRERRRMDNAALRALSVERVTTACRQLLDGGSWTASEAA